MSEVETVRAFNRLYTRKLGILNEGLLQSRFSLAEARVLYEIANRETPPASVLAEELGVDAGYLSRILRRLQNLGLLARRKSHLDARQRLLSLTSKGRTEFARLNERSSREIEELLKPLSVSERGRLTEAMRTIGELLAPDARRAAETFVLRPHRVGDMGHVVKRQSEIYHDEYGWNGEFEALVAKIAGDFLDNFQPDKEYCWIAERRGEPVGSVFLVRKDDEVAKLRMLYVDSQARGLGVGGRLVEECVRFARRAGYRRITLWTQSVLVAARRIYERNGFRLVDQKPHHSFGADLIGETWELEL